MHKLPDPSSLKKKIFLSLALFNVFPALVFLINMQVLLLVRPVPSPNLLLVLVADVACSVFAYLQKKIDVEFVLPIWSRRSEEAFWAWLYLPSLAIIPSVIGTAISVGITHVWLDYLPFMLLSYGCLGYAIYLSGKYVRILDRERLRRKRKK